MKRIQVLRNLGFGLPRFSEGEIVDVEDATAAVLIGQSLAVEAPTPAAEPVAAEARDAIAQGPAVPEPADAQEQTRRQPGHAKRSRKTAT